MSSQLKKDSVAEIHMLEYASSQEKSPAQGPVDYSGAYEKTDEKEIALVKKLDRWIMVSSNRLELLVLKINDTF